MASKAQQKTGLSSGSKRKAGEDVSKPISKRTKVDAAQRQTRVSQLLPYADDLFQVNDKNKFIDRRTADHKHTLRAPLATISSLTAQDVENQVVQVKDVADEERRLIVWAATNMVSNSVQANQALADAAAEAENAHLRTLERVSEASSSIAHVEMTISRLRTELQAANEQHARLQSMETSLQLQAEQGHANALRFANLALAHRDMAMIAAADLTNFSVYRFQEQLQFDIDSAGVDTKTRSDRHALSRALADLEPQAEARYHQLHRTHMGLIVPSDGVTVEAINRVADATWASGFGGPADDSNSTRKAITRPDRRMTHPEPRRAEPGRPGPRPWRPTTHPIPQPPNTYHETSEEDNEDGAVYEESDSY